VDTTKKGDQLENYVHYVYSSLIKHKARETKLYQKYAIKGCTGVEYIFDLFYEFDYLMTKHRVAIECKNWEKPVSINDISAFCNKIEDVGNIRGVFISKSGYQSGAKELANKKGISIFTEEEFPTILDIMQYPLKALLPDKDVVGEPFWTLMEVDKSNNNTGTYYAYGENNKLNILLFFSKKDAYLCSTNILNKNYNIYGVSKNHLEVLFRLVKSQSIGICVAKYPVLDYKRLVTYAVDYDIFKEDFL